MLEKMHQADHQLMPTRRTRYSENMNIFMNVKKSLNKQGSTQKNARYK